MFSCYSCFTLSNIYKLLLVSFSENLVVVNSSDIFSKKRMITPQDSPFLVPWKGHLGTGCSCSGLRIIFAVLTYRRISLKQQTGPRDRRGITPIRDQSIQVEIEFHFILCCYCQSGCYYAYNLHIQLQINWKKSLVQTNFCTQ